MRDPIEPLEPERQRDRFGIGLCLFAATLFFMMTLRMLVAIVQGNA